MLICFFCQVDHEKRDGLEHKIERELVNDMRMRTMSQDSAGELIPNPLIVGNELRSRGTGGGGATNENNI